MLCLHTHIMLALCSMPAIAYDAQNYARPIGAALTAVPHGSILDYA